MHVLYMATSGPADATRASIPWHLAVNGSIAAGQTAALFLAGDASEVLKEGVRATVEGFGLPALRELVIKARENGVAVHV